MRLAVLGGSFNPVHIGHLFLAGELLHGQGYDRVLLVPAYQSPFKLEANIGPSSRDRLDMLLASITGDERLSVEDCEIRREGISYTIDTLRDIIRRYQPEGKPGLVIGDDLAEGFLSWKDSSGILDIAEIIIARRNGTEAKSRPFPCRQLENEIMDISSGLVRERIKAGAAWEYLVPAGARIIIEDRSLYREASGSPAAGDPEITKDFLVRIEEEARRRLSPGRFLHSRNTALLARDLAERWSQTPAAAWLAGMGHDICKSMKDGELLELARKDGMAISAFEEKKASLLHGRAAAVFLRERFGIEREDVLEAIRVHTAGEPGMGPLARILYIADKIEVGREKIDPALRKLVLEKDLEEVFPAVLEQTVSWLRARHIDLLKETLDLLKSAREGMKHEEKQG
ncbi:MAG: nicotinate (nicotinamide) nucleotide adenylyltransferase [Treponema sp.]|nr:nicotinate (nicotinamide) nucleotide adenylyltransferase [Treponema sp.]